jgi:hypothetical protein
MASLPGEGRQTSRLPPPDEDRADRHGFALGEAVRVVRAVGPVGIGDGELADLAERLHRVAGRIEPPQHALLRIVPARTAAIRSAVGHG